MYYTYKTQGVCSSEIRFELNNGIVSNVSFLGGCNGNLKAISKLINGMPATDVINKLQGNTCGPRQTSCADQLTKALNQALNKQ